MTAAWPPPPDDGSAHGRAPASPQAAPLTCYRHQRAEAPVACNRCDRPICTECMVSAPVGWQCPSCVKGGPVVRNMRDVRAGGSLVGDRPYATFGLIGLSALAFLLQMGDPTIDIQYGISAIGIDSGRLEQLVTSGFLHGGTIHLLFNMLLLFQLGGALEARLGRARFCGVYAAGLVGGAVGHLLMSNPGGVAVGASGAVFALMGCVLVLPKRSRFGIEGSVGGLLLMNLVITFIPGMNIAIGGHLGGLAIGLLVGAAYRLIGDSSDLVRVATSTGFAVVVTIVLVLAASPIADWSIQNRLS